MYAATAAKVTRPQKRAAPLHWKSQYQVGGTGAFMHQSQMNESTQKASKSACKVVDRSSSFVLCRIKIDMIRPSFAQTVLYAR